MFNWDVPYMCQTLDYRREQKSWLEDQQQKLHIKFKIQYLILDFKVGGMEGEYSPTFSHTSNSRKKILQNSAMS